MKHKKAQQEMIGFILIVVLVVVGMMIFLVISLKNQGGEDSGSLEASNLLDALLRYTTDCAIVFEPQYDTFEDLFKSAYHGDTCSNKGVSAESYLVDHLEEVLSSLLEGEATAGGIQVMFIERDDSGEAGIIPPIMVGDCSGSASVQSAQRSLVSESQRLIIRLSICRLA